MLTLFTFALPSSAFACPTTLSPTGGDDTSAIQNAINSCVGVTLNSGTFNISCTGIALGQGGRIFGAGSGATTITTTCTNKPMVTHSSTNTPGIKGVRLTRSVTAVSGGTGIDGTGNNSGQWYLNDVEVDHQYIGIKEDGAAYAPLFNLKVHDNVSDGINVVTPSGADRAMTLYLDTVQSYNNGGWGLYWNGQHAGFTSTGDWVKVSTWGNTLGGAKITGTTAQARVTLSSFSGDSGVAEFVLDTAAENTYAQMFTDTIFNNSSAGRGLYITSSVVTDVSVVNSSTAYGANGNCASGILHDGSGTLLIRGGQFNSNGTCGTAGNKFGILGNGRSGSRMGMDGITAQSNQTYNVVANGGTVVMSLSNSHVTPNTMVSCGATTCNYLSGSGNW
jgi:hypothetical protein